MNRYWNTTLSKVSLNKQLFCLCFSYSYLLLRGFFFIVSQLAFQTTLLSCGFPCALWLSFSEMRYLLFSRPWHPDVLQLCILYQVDKRRTVHNLRGYTILGSTRYWEMSGHLPAGIGPRQRLESRSRHSSMGREMVNCWIWVGSLLEKECFRERPFPSSPVVST